MSKKIAFIINSLAGGGAEKLVKTLLEQFHNDGWYVELICLEKDDIYSVDKNIKVTYLTEWDKSVSGIKKLLFLPVLAFRLFNYMKKHQIETVQSHLFRASYVNLLAKFFFRSRHNVQIVNHSVISRYKNEGMSGKINLFLIKKLYPYADRIISVSSVVQKDMQELFGFKNEKKVIYNMFDLNEIQNLSKEKINDFKFDKAKKYIVSVGRLIPLKRNHDLIYVLSGLDSNVELIFIGDGEEKNNLIDLSKKLDIYKRIHFLGWVDNPYKYIYHSNILACTSQTESFGNVLVEAMACGVPVVSTKCGGPEEIIDDEADGYLVDIGDVDSMVEKINLILNDDELSNKLILNAKEKIKLFDSASIIKEYKKILGEKV
ncbi:glycosyltransferase [Malaciobacter marinus]|jgi:N-acetylgalactosamine-N,N'-diacetylbacillosaminyl-diphospho-undecaprenol 4-alpha-N-acetylgalactosaminyltransferase|uniref:glycosyltransferase n=1 Tax=Malaciobacter marinus TaxID=505249 RepID=UPI0009D1D30E|nr:glycosyltransferase [Malaciobacter marinus]SKB26438.1 N-acetylgalactosamine-N,N'-diacetylbacillosaminyl-diphospho-undecaprenol 4-alpha-N-acetylgalactosaminyltransferase [Malaciobacter marinus]